VFWLHGKQKIESNTTGYRLVKTKLKTKGGSTHSLKHLTPLLQVFYLHCRWQPVAVSNLFCSGEGVAWKAKYGG
jgi:hypothetical protein